MFSPRGEGWGEGGSYSQTISKCPAFDLLRFSLALAGLFLIHPRLTAGTSTADVASSPPSPRLKHIVVYEDPRFYAAFPSVVKRPNGELLLAFRRAPDRRAFRGQVTHTDPNSYLVMVRSKTRGESWEPEPQLIYAHPFGGSQDPCLVQLRNGTILCSSYAWASLGPEQMAALKQPVARAGNFAFLGGFLLASKDGGKSWQAPKVPPASPGEVNLDLFGQPVPAYNRGAMCEGRDGLLYWVVAAGTSNAPNHTVTHLLISADHGQSWKYSAPVANDPQIEFNEASLYETPRGDLVAFLRTEKFNDHTVVARSRDHGRSFAWTDAGFQGHPHFALRLPDRRVLLVYGYRHQPFGIRARILDPECTNPATAPEIVLRDDGGNGDLGYPWAVNVAKNRVLVVYYFNRRDGPRHIAGTFLQLD